MSTDSANATKMPLFVDFQESAQGEKCADVVVFFHGWGMHSSIWAQVRDAVNPHFHTLCIDLPGMGRSPIPKGDYTLAAIVQQCRTALKPYEHFRLHFVGWSLGALVAAELENSLPPASLALIAMGPWFIQSPDQLQEHLQEQLPELGMPLAEFQHFQTLLAEDLEGTLYRFLGLNTKNSQHQRAELRVLQQLVFCFGLPAPKALAGGLDILSQAQLLPHLHHNGRPLWIALGEKDALVSIEFAHWIEKNRPDIQCSIFIGAGHIPFLSQPTEFAERLVSFIKSSDSHA